LSLLIDKLKLVERLFALRAHCGRDARAPVKFTVGSCLVLVSHAAEGIILRGSSPSVR